MRLRPASAHWFESYVPRGETVYALEALANTGRVELEQDPRTAQPLNLEPVRRLVNEFQALRRRNQVLLPTSGPRAAAVVELPERMAEKALDFLKQWTTPVQELQQEQLRLETERQNLLLVYECVTALRSSHHDLRQLSEPSRFLYKGVFACPHEHHLEADVCAAIDEFIPGLEHDFFLVADLPNKAVAIRHAYRSTACLCLNIPPWLPDSPEAQQARLAEHTEQLEGRLEEIGEQLEKRAADPDLLKTLADIDILRWYLGHAGEMAEKGSLCHVSGWTQMETAKELQQAFSDARIHAAIRFAPAPAFSRPPVRMLLPWWAQPFRLFVEMLGTPGSSEVDPSGLLPLIVPLLFGYMFPDLGHGLILAAVGTLLYRRWPEGRFLIPCGLSAAGFGLVFGEALGIEGLLEPLWLKPMEHPLTVIVAPLFAGVGLLLLGLVFNGVEAHWQGALRNWLTRDAAMLVMYVAGLGGLLDHRLWWLVPAALTWFLVGQLLSADSRRLGVLAANIALLLQSLFELVLNTFSFLRVGAFALAHAGLSSAILALADNIANPALHYLFLGLGHLLIVAIEGLVVFVQTTRLVLFEFFIRFLHAEGRIFKPLSGPDHMTK